MIKAYVHFIRATIVWTSHTQLHTHTNFAIYRLEVYMKLGSAVIRVFEVLQFAMPKLCRAPWLYSTASTARWHLHLGTYSCSGAASACSVPWFRDAIAIRWALVVPQARYHRSTRGRCHTESERRVIREIGWRCTAIKSRILLPHLGGEVALAGWAGFEWLFLVVWAWCAYRRRWTYQMESTAKVWFGTTFLAA
jgi:hypothetical protein